MLALLALLLVSSPSDRGARVDARCRNDRRISPTGHCGEAAPSGPLFEFATASGAGLSSACACADVTGAKGEAMTFTRSSTGTCLKGNTSTGIANGDLVTCAADKPRVMPGGDGTGGLGLSVWEARTNVALRSEEFDNAAWTTLGSGTTYPVVTANQAVAPDGTTTADRVDLGATTGGQRSVLYQVPGLTVASSTSVFVKGVSGSGTMDVCSLGHCTPCAFVSTSWTRCADEGVTWSAGTSPFFGNTSSDNGGTARPAQSVYLWGAQYEAGSRVSPYIKTAGTSATRTVENATFALSSGGAVKVSASSTIVAPASFAGSPVGLLWYASVESDNYLKASVTTGAKLACNFRTSATDNTQTSTGTVTASASNTVACYYDLANKADCLNGSCETTAATITLPTYTVLGLGGLAAANKLNGVVKKVCVDTTAGGCQ